MPTKGHDRSRVAARVRLPAIEHEAHGPVSAVVQLAAWLGRWWSARAPALRAGH